MRIAVLGLPASDSLIRQAVSLVEHESVSLLGKPYIATQSQIAEIIKAGFPESPPDSLSITDLRQLGKILRVTYVIDISSRRVGSDFEVSGRLLSSSENTNSENPKSVVLQSVRRPVLSEAVKEFTTLLSKENLQTK
jgi:hypothetical protein